VGFCGFAPPLGMPWSRTKAKEAMRWVLNRTGLLRFTSAVPGPFVRVQALRALQKSRHVDTNFLIRGYKSTSRGGRWKNAPASIVNVDRQSQLDFLDNMLRSDYVLSTRGHGNFSYRLYESLACGRIPLFIDTDCVLPFDFEIDWRQSCIWVDDEDVSSIAERVLEFHRSVTPDDFMDLQIACRRLWEERLSPEGFFRNFYRHLDRVGVRLPERPAS
jgi:Exostosin family